jgi:hypothetical protein
MRLLRLTAVALVAVAGSMQAQGIPDRLSDAEFWHMFTDFSEGPGQFQSENLLSNETGFQRVIPELLRTVKPGGVYIGVGPEQNFTYVAALHPRMAFIVDIRHQNATYHLLYKALIEMSDNRADFLSKLFSRPRPAGLTTNTSVDSLFAAYAAVPHDSLLWYKTLAEVKDRLRKFHGFALDTSEIMLLTRNFDALYWAGTGLSYNYGNGNSGRGGGQMPTYHSLMTATDGAGIHRSYLSADSTYQVLRDLELRNMLVPLTGDFAGPKALRTVAEYVKKNNAVVTTMYCSNVEQYLFQNAVWFTFEGNVATLPLDSTSTFIRSGRPGGGGIGGGGGMAGSFLQSMQWLVKATADNKINTYPDVLNSSTWH